jgi:ATP-binding cassette subfamily B (MDR/TAP) protein 1
MQGLGLTAILRQEVGWFDADENNSSLVASRLSDDATLVRAFVGDRASVILMTLALMLLAFGIAFYLDWKVAFVVLATYPFMVGAFIGEVNMSYFIIFYSILEKQDEFLE